MKQSMRLARVLLLLCLIVTTEAHLVQFAYTSASAVRYTPFSVIRNILDVSQLNNRRDGITGILLYKDDSFLQIIEGEDLVMRDLIYRITADTRHKRMFIFYNKKIDERDFSFWTLAFRTPQFSEALQARFRENNFNDYIENPCGITNELSRQTQLLLTLFEKLM